MKPPILHEKLEEHEYALAGAVSGSVTRFLCQPVDVIKVRFQLQVEPLSKKGADSKYWSISQATKRILKEEGAFAFWKGHIPAQLLSVTYGFMQFLTFEVLTQNVQFYFPTIQNSKEEPVVYFLCGASAGVWATLLSFPLDVLRTRLIAQGEPKLYKSITHAVTMIYMREGVRGFYKGLFPSVLQIAPHTGAQFAFYEVFTRLWHTWGNVADDKKYSALHANTLLGSLLCGSLAGATSKALVYPLDLAKRRLQVQGFEDARRPFGQVFTCGGMMHCLEKTWRNEGFSGLFKGLYPSLLKAGLVTAFNFTIYEQICQALNNIHRKR